ncbi:MAG: ribonuclease E/G, partial [Pseudomonadota bacterium]
GGYLVIGVTEALVAIDVNSGRSTKEGSIEETAVKTNLEAADEVARQLRLRDLAGLIVIDFIDMDEGRNNRAVEKRMKDRLKNDRARIQVGRISGFGLMEMSRQRLRPGMLEATTKPCPHCHGQGFIRSDESLALGILREIEEHGVKGNSAEVVATMPVDIANFIVNSKRKHLAQIEERYGLEVQLMGDPTMVSPEFKLERVKGADRGTDRGADRGSDRGTERRREREVPAAVSAESGVEVVEDAETVEEAPSRNREDGRRRNEDSRDDGGDGSGKKRRRGKRGGRRRRGGNGDERERPDQPEGEEVATADTAAVAEDALSGDAPVETAETNAAEPVPVAETVAETVAEAATAEPETVASEPVPIAEDPAPAAEAEPQAEAEPHAEVAIAEPVAAETVVAEAPAPQPEPEPQSEPEAEKKPKRRGWWSLRR